MKTLTDYILTTINEELTEKQKKKVDNMPRMDYSVKQLHDKVFGNSDRIILPYHGSTEDEKITTGNFESKFHHDSHATRVLKELEGKGYHTDDYESGLAYHKDSPNRHMKIGKILEKEGITDKQTSKTNKKGQYMTIKQLYDADPIRAAGTKEKQIVISKNRYDVAGMSTDRGWSSCMDMGDGVNKHYLQHDMKHGTLTAYVTQKGDDEIKNPIGRVNIKRFTSTDRHSIFRPEFTHQVGYGSIPQGVRGVLEHWTEHHYPSRPGIYVKSHELYNDNGDQIKFEKPEQMKDDDDHALENIHHIIDDNISAESERLDHHMNKFNNDFGIHEDVHDKISSNLHHLMNKFSDSSKLHFTVHQIADRTDDNNTEYPTDHHISDVRGYHFTQQWAKDQIGLKNYRHQVRDTSPEKLLAYHEILHKSGVTARSPEEHEEHQELHSEIIDHLLKHAPDHIKDHVLNQVTDDASNHEDYYHPMLQNIHTMFDHMHPAEHTKNPRLIHTILSRNLDRFPKGEMTEDAAKHIGEHADIKLAKDLVSGDLGHHMNTYDHIDAFHSGIIKNPHGEDIHHEILNHMNLTGGENSTQNKFHAYRNINGAPMYIHTKPHEWIDHASDEDLHDHFRQIAEKSPFKSVHSIMKNRPDFKNDEEIQNALHDNPHA